MRKRGLILFLVFFSWRAQAHDGFVRVSSKYKDKFTQKEETISGVGFTLRDRLGRWYVSTCAHVSEGDNESLAFEGFVIKSSDSRISDSSHDVSLIEVNPPATGEPLFEIDQDGNATLRSERRFLRVDYSTDRLLLAPWLSGTDLGLSQDRVGNLDTLPPAYYRATMGETDENLSSVDDRLSMAKIAPGFSGSPVVRMTNGVGRLIGIVKTYHRFYFESGWSSNVALTNLYLNFLKGQRGEQSKSQWHMWNRITFRSAGDFWEISPLKSPSGGVSGNGGEGGVSGNGGEGGVSGNGGEGGVSGNGGNGFLDVWGKISQGARWQGHDIVAIEGPCFDDLAHDCRYDTDLKVFEKILSSAQLNSFKFLTSKDVAHDNLPRRLGISKREVLHGRSMWTVAEVRPQGPNFIVDVLFYTDQIHVVVSPQDYRSIYRVLCTKGKACVTLDAHSKFKGKPSADQRLYDIDVGSLLFSPPPERKPGLYIRLREEQSPYEYWYHLVE